jgi:NAD(P)-dependent dehydrogenase (short-subunit alcohol dehydrogenase family)
VEFREKVSLVTGAGSGIGRATALQLAAQGSKVLITDVIASRLDETQSTIAAQGGEAFSQLGELASLEDLQRLVAVCDERFGRLDVLVNNAGTHSGGAVEDYTWEEWDRVHAVNAKAPFFLTQCALPLMQRAGGGAIVNVSSMSGVLGQDSMSVYCSSKGAVVALTRALAYDLAPFNIRVNCVCPGLTKTAQPATFLAHFSEEEQARLQEGWTARHIIKRAAEADEIANAILYLASDKASFSTGLIMPVDAGTSAW